MEYRNINSEITESFLDSSPVRIINISNEVVFFILLAISLMVICYCYFYFKYKSNIRTVNMDKTNTDYEPVDRNTALGNPFKLKDFPLIESLKSYKGYLNYKVYIEKDQAIIDQLNDLYRKSKEGKLNLGCHCKPLPCHSDIIAKFVRKMKGEL